MKISMVIGMIVSAVVLGRRKTSAFQTMWRSGFASMTLFPASIPKSEILSARLSLTKAITKTPEFTATSRGLIYPANSRVKPA